MFLLYSPDGQPAQRFHFQPGRLRTAEMIAIERRTGLKYGEFKQALMQGGTVARQALLWTFLRRQHLDLRFDDVDFCDDELVLQLDRDELAAEIEALQNFTGMSDADREAALGHLRRELATAPYAPGKEPPLTEHLQHPPPAGEDLPGRYPDPAPMNDMAWPPEPVMAGPEPEAPWAPATDPQQLDPSRR